MVKRLFAFAVFGILAVSGSASGAELRISLAQAMEMAFMNNPDLRSSRLDYEIARINVEQVKAQYDPYLSVGGNFSRSNRPTSTPAFGNENRVDSVSLGTGVSTPSGGNLSMSWSNSKTESNSSFMTLNPSYSSDFSVNASQPLLKNGLDWRGNQLKQRTNDLRRAEINLKSKALETASRVEDAYWSLVKARMNREIAERGVARAQSQFDLTQAQVRVGLAAEVSLLQAQANLESNRVDLIRNEAELARTENNLKDLLYFQTEESLAGVAIIPSDMPSAAEFKIIAREFLDSAISKNYTLKQLELNLENTKIDTRQSRNQLLPQLDFNGALSLSGLAGRAEQSTQVIPTGFVIPNPLPGPQPYIMEFTTIPPSANTLEGDWYDAVDGMLNGNNLSWQAGLSFRVPVGNRAAAGQYEIQKYNYEKTLMEAARQKRTIRFSLETLLTDVDSAYRGWQTAKLARELAEKGWRIEQKKFSLGMSTQFNLLDQEQQLRQAEMNEASALIEYNKAAGRIRRAEQGYLETGGIAGISFGGFNIPSMGGMNLGSLAGGMGGLSSLMGMLPAGIDLNMLKGMGINLP